MADTARANQDWEPDIYGDPDPPLDRLLDSLNRIAVAHALAVAAGREADSHATPTTSGFPRERYRTYAQWLVDRAERAAMQEAAA